MHHFSFSFFLHSRHPQHALMPLLAMHKSYNPKYDLNTKNMVINQAIVAIGLLPQIPAAGVFLVV